MGSGVEIRIGRFSAQTPLGTWSGLGTQLRYEALGDLQIEIVKIAVINIGLVMAQSWPWHSQIAVKQML